MCCIYSGSRFLRCPKNKVWPELCRSIEFRESKGDFRLILPANRGLKWRKLVSLLFVSSVIVFHFPTSAGSCAQVKPLLGLEPFFPTWIFLQGCRDASSQLKHLPQSGNVSNHQDDSLPAHHSTRFLVRAQRHQFLMELESAAWHMCFSEHWVPQGTLKSPGWSLCSLLNCHM